MEEKKMKEEEEEREEKGNEEGTTRREKNEGDISSRSSEGREAVRQGDGTGKKNPSVNEVKNMQHM